MQVGSAIYAIRANKVKTLYPIYLFYIFFSLLMCGLPSIATHLLYSDQGEYQSRAWILDVILLIHFHTLPYVYPIGLAGQTASVYLTVVVTIER